MKGDVDRRPVGPNTRFVLTTGAAGGPAAEIASAVIASGAGAPPAVTAPAVSPAVPLRAPAAVQVMKVATGRVVSGRVVVDGSDLLQEGAGVGVVVPSDGGGFDLSADDEAALVRVLEAAEAEAFVPADELLRRLG